MKKTVIYFTHHVHHCVLKALNITGLHEAIRKTIPVNENFQMDHQFLRNEIEKYKESGLTPFMVVATAGTTDTGAIDPLNSIADICLKHQLWFHVDAACGGFFILLEEIKEKFKGIERADSLVMDPHKSLFIPYGLGMVLVRDQYTLLDSNSHKATYMQDAYGLKEINPSDCSPELSRHFRGLRIWRPLHLHGINVFKVNLEEKILLCRYFHESIKAMGFETGPLPELSITLFRYPVKEKDKFTRNYLMHYLKMAGSFSHPL